ncbi:MAG: hypothetical protein L6416_07750 [Candidatus Omnitrophica bacterium]|nr:hypothetical protein [Candidatus Omnitrophota bacterium]
MNKLKKLGKGLEDISYLFLSTDEENSFAEEPAAKEKKKDLIVPELSTKSICLIGNYCDYRDAFLIVNLSFALARLGMRIAVVDIDENLSCLNFFQGKKPREERASIQETIIQEGPLGVKLIGLNPVLIAHLFQADKKTRLSLELDDVEKNVDLILLSIMPKDLENAMPLINRQMRESLVLVSPDKHEMLNAYKIIKLMFLHNPLAKIGVIITEIEHMYEIDAVYDKMARVVKKYLDKELYKYGFLFKLKQDVGSEANIASFYDADLMACISNIAQIIILRLNLEKSESKQKPLFKRMLTEFMNLR